MDRYSQTAPRHGKARCRRSRHRRASPDQGLLRALQQFWHWLARPLKKRWVYINENKNEKTLNQLFIYPGQQDPRKIEGWTSDPGFVLQTQGLQNPVCPRAAPMWHFLPKPWLQHVQSCAPQPGFEEPPLKTCIFMIVSRKQSTTSCAETYRIIGLLSKLCFTSLLFTRLRPN